MKETVDEIVLVCHGYLDCAADNQNLRDRLAAVEAERDAAVAEVERLREDAARNRWCEEMKADVNYGFHSGGVYAREWFVQWDGIGTAHDVHHPDRNAAIDAARGKK